MTNLKAILVEAQHVLQLWNNNFHVMETFLFLMMNVILMMITKHMHNKRSKMQANYVGFDESKITANIL